MHRLVAVCVTVVMALSIGGCVSHPGPKDSAASLRAARSAVVLRTGKGQDAEFSGTEKISLD